MDENEELGDSGRNGRLDGKRAKKACIWLQEYCTEIAELGDLMSLRANRLNASKVKISRMKDVQNISKVVHSLELLMELSMKNIQKANDKLSHSFKQWKIKHISSFHSNDGVNITLSSGSPQFEKLEENSEHDGEGSIGECSRAASVESDGKEEEWQSRGGKIEKEEDSDSLNLLSQGSSKSVRRQERTDRKNKLPKEETAEKQLVGMSEGADEPKFSFSKSESIEKHVMKQTVKGVSAKAIRDAAKRNGFEPLNEKLIVEDLEDLFDQYLGSNDDEEMDMAVDQTKSQGEGVVDIKDNESSSIKLAVGGTDSCSTSDPEICNTKAKVGGTESSDKKPNIDSSELSRIKPVVGRPESSKMKPVVGGPESSKIKPNVGGPESSRIKTEVGSPESCRIKTEVGSRKSSSTILDVAGQKSSSTKPNIGGPKSSSTKPDVGDPELSSTKPDVGVSEYFSSKQDVGDPELSSTKPDVGVSEYFSSKQDGDPELSSTKPDVGVSEYFSSKQDVGDPELSSTNPDVDGPESSCTKSNIGNPESSGIKLDVGGAEYSSTKLVINGLESFSIGGDVVHASEFTPAARKAMKELLDSSTEESMLSSLDTVVSSDEEAVRQRRSKSRNYQRGQKKSVSKCTSLEGFEDKKLSSACFVKLQRLSSCDIEEPISKPPSHCSSEESEDSASEELKRLLNIQNLKKRKRWLSSPGSEGSDAVDSPCKPRERRKIKVGYQKDRLSETFSSTSEDDELPSSKQVSGRRLSGLISFKELEEELERKRNKLAKDALLQTSSSDADPDLPSGEEDASSSTLERHSEGRSTSPSVKNEASSVSLLKEQSKRKDAGSMDEVASCSLLKEEGKGKGANSSDEDEVASCSLLKKEGEGKGADSVDENEAASPIVKEEDGGENADPTIANEAVSPIMFNDHVNAISVDSTDEDGPVSPSLLEKKDEAEEDCTVKDGKQKGSWRNNALLRGRLTDSLPREDKEKTTGDKGSPSNKVFVVDSSSGSDEESPSNGKKRAHSSDSNSDSKSDLPRVKKVARETLDSSIINLDSSDDSDDVFIPVRPAYRSNKASSSATSFKNENGIRSKSGGLRDWLLTAKSRAPKKTEPAKKKAAISDSNDDDDDDDDAELNASPNKTDTPNKGRKNIRAVMSDDTIAEATQVALKEEEERRKRIAEKQKMYEEAASSCLKNLARVDKLVLDIDPKTREPLVQVDRKLACKLKPHQVKGVKFMWDASFESLKRARETRGSGCILAHCMGLGKTFQVVTLVHTVVTHKATKTVLIVCPLNTVLNWVSEFSMWLRETENVWKVKVFELSRCKQNYDRGRLLQSWYSGGGVMVIGYEMFRNLANVDNDVFKKTLLDPGPDLVVCDEGHLLKNEKTAVSKAMCKIRTLRRIVLTGTPLQNNLKEYHCMVQFVKPNLLGTLKEFRNRFVNPINNGQFEDSTPHDVKVMKRRAHVLHKMLEGSVQRFDYAVLRPLLPPKHEYVISVRLTDLQIKLYERYLRNRLNDGVPGTQGAQLFADYQALYKVWTHPLVLKMGYDRNNKGGKEPMPIPSIFLKSNSSSEKENMDVDSDDSDIMIIDPDGSEKPIKKGVKGVLKEEVEDVSLKGEWWTDLLKGGEMEDMRESGKLVLLFAILKDCETIGDKLLVFSQSLFTLDLIEYFLKRINKASRNDIPEESLNNHMGTWIAGKDYFRLDGAAPAENRIAWCKAFNRPDNKRPRLFLISTRAGGLGINLYGANRAIIFDASWNPSHDVQSIFRVYRFGQKKTCYIYRFLASGTMEEKIYDRQVTKLSLSCRVVDEQQIERHFNMSDLAELYRFTPQEKTKRPIPILPKDVVLAELLKEYENNIDNYHEHDSLLENKEEEELNEEERKAAWEDYEKEKRGPWQPPEVNMPPPRNNFTSEADFHEILRRQFPNMPSYHLNEKARFLLRRFNEMRGNTQGTSSGVPPHLMTRSLLQPLPPRLPPPAHQALPSPHLQQSKLQRDEALMARHSMAALFGGRTLPGQAQFSGVGRYHPPYSSVPRPMGPHQYSPHVPLNRPVGPQLGHPQQTNSRSSINTAHSTKLLSTGSSKPS